MDLEISQLEQLVKELPFKIIDISSESEENFYLTDFKVVKDLNSLIQNIRDYSCICKYMKARIKYNEAFSDRLNNLMNILQKSKRFLKDISEIQRSIIALNPIFSIKVIKKIFCHI